MTQYFPATRHKRHLMATFQIWSCKSGPRHFASAWTYSGQSQDAKKIKIAFNAANKSPDIVTIRQFCRIPVKQMTWSNLVWLKSAVTHLIIVYSTLLSSALGRASMALSRLCDWNKFGDPGWLELMGWTRVVKQEVRPWFKIMGSKYAVRTSTLVNS